MPRIACLPLLLFVIAGCSRSPQAPPAPPPPAVSVMKVGTRPFTVFEDYSAQTEAVDAVEIRARVGGILERQAFKDGARVKKGDVLFVLDQQPYLAARSQSAADLGQAQASLLNSRQNLERLRPLLEDQAISRQDYDAAVAKDRSDAAAVEARKAALRQAQLNLDYTVIRAPRDGIMGKALIKSGGLVNTAATLLATLYSIDPIYVDFTISEQRLNALQKIFNTPQANGQPLSFRIKLGDGSDYPHPGRLNFLDTAVDPRNGTLQVRLATPNPGGMLRSGQFVHVIVPTREDPNAILVPQQAVQEVQGKHSVLVVDAANKVVYRDIDASLRSGHEWLVERGLRPGELVIVEGTSKARPGTMVKPVLQAPANQVASGDGRS